MNEPKVSIVTINFNGLKDTLECLESLKKINYPNYSIIVVDNGSVTPDVDCLKKKYGDEIETIPTGENLGFPEGNNVGISDVRQLE
jgi:GT2 family glycosyltransferase